MMDLRETIKQIFDSEINYREGLFKIPTKEDRPKNRRMINVLKQIKKDVLAELTNYKLIPVEKWQEIVELIKNHPDEFHAGKLILWFEILEAKVAELKDVAT